MRRLLPLLGCLVLTAADPAEAVLAQKDPAPMMAELRHLTEAIGPRLTGSPRDHAAHAWAAARFRAMGLKVEQEPFPLARTWTRGKAWARLAGGASIPVAQWGWTPGTKGRIRGPLVLLQNPKDVEALGPRLRGAIVLAGEPSTVLDPLLMNPPLRVKERPVHENTWPVEMVAARLKAAGVKAILRDAGKSGERLNMTSPDPLDSVDLPVAFVPHGAYGRLAKGGELELELGGRFGPAGHGLNTIATLEGESGEAVVLGAHLDSWDLATGATDNGAGAAAVMEAARILSGLRSKPRRSIRFVLFGGEEQGYLGSLSYVKAHAAELPKLSGVFVTDTGAGAIDAWALQGRAQVEKVLSPLLGPLQALGVTDTDLRNEADTDFEPFDKAGVPAFCAEQKQHTYAADHHAESDTLDRVLPSELHQAAVVMAFTAWKVAELPAMLPRER